jgi:hypothetical protein
MSLLNAYRQAARLRLGLSKYIGQSPAGQAQASLALVAVGPETASGC